MPAGWLYIRLSVAAVALICASGSDNLCSGRKVYGLDMNGGLAEYVAVPSNCLFPIPKDMSFIEGSLVEPLANAMHVVSRLDVTGRAGLIYGAGPIGVLCALAAKQAGAAKVAVIDRNPHRLGKMAELEIETRVLVVREIDLKGSYAYTRADFAAAITMLERNLLPWRSFIAEARLSEGQLIFDNLGTGHSAIIKAVFTV